MNRKITRSPRPKLEIPTGLTGADLEDFLDQQRKAYAEELRRVEFANARLDYERLKKKRQAREDAKQQRIEEEHQRVRELVELAHGDPTKKALLQIAIEEIAASEKRKRGRSSKD